MKISRHPNVISIKDDFGLVGVLIGATQDDGTYHVNHLWSASPDVLVPMMAAFRPLHRGQRIRFEYQDDNAPMVRMCKALGAVRCGDSYEFTMPPSREEAMLQHPRHEGMRNAR